MNDDAIQPGRIRRLAEGFEGCLERWMGHKQETVWRMLTEPSQFVQWLAPGSIELRKAGRVHIDFGDSGVVIDSTVLAFDPPRLLAYSWSSGDGADRPLRWELDALGGGTALTLTVQLPEGEDIAKACAGFEAHLDMLAAALEGVPIRFPFDRYIAARHAYQKLMAE
ncbi:SRPBCC family protein [Mesorhizobium sp.]|uniref:SRPBCC family protein n=1 Tax=Mesorhizobium sp. TaxID=1871066 RepID=UPI000FE438F6|nr:SRPBCC family protein [Mesorhizobium sp.]RWH73507.1 MAG: SRPBCC family protein [Mesorhizobium sp.]RWL31366.1 MAG: SRPBCC family protein [Mesorhizobium sp.]RWL36573.1 MAG: SRPBCC family protein [Mesorhizobium sp.]RWL40667.1 MAG: SRPBCC family protein [Mesorhizobium sp.]RWL58724.1 MAG: SRPBCC family protein [Mesorhizobium sp.]